MMTPSDLDALLEYIQSCINAPDRIDEEMLRDESAAFSEAIYELNVRLAACEQLIDRGLRDEAIDEAGRDGELLTLYEKLDIADRELWEQLVDAFGFPTPPALNEDAAIKLNMAFAILNDLDDLLKKHRMFALGRAPLEHRIRILNALVERDPENPLWRENAATFQQTRLKQLVNEVNRATANEDEAALERLDRELTGSQWWIEVPPKMIAQVRTARAVSKRREMVAQIQSEGGQLQDAMLSDDLESAFASADSIRNLANRAKLLPDDPVMLELLPALQWVDDERARMVQEQQRYRLIESLCQTISSPNSTRDKVDAALKKATAAGASVPDDVREKAKQRLKAFDSAAFQRKLMLGGAIAMAASVLAAAAGFFVWRGHRAGIAKEVERRLTEYVVLENWEEAVEYFNEQPDDVKGFANVQSVALTINTKLREEKERASAFASTLEALQADDSEPPNEKLLERLRELKRTVDDERMFAEQETKAKQKRDDYVNRIAAKNKEQVRLATNEFDGLLQTRLKDDSYLAKLRDKRNDLLRLQLTVEKETPSLIYDVKRLIEQLALEEDTCQEGIARQQAIDRITNAIGNLESYQATIEELVRNDPYDVMANDLKQIADRIDEYQSVMVWKKILEHPSYTIPLSVDEDDAVTWLQLLNEAIEIAPGHALAREPQIRRGHYETLVRRPQIIEELRGLGKSKLLEPIYIYDFTFNNQDTRFYSPDPPDGTGRKSAHVIEYFVDFSFTKREYNFGTLDYAKTVRPKARLSGQSKFGEKLNDMLFNINAKNFTPESVKILNMLLDIPEEDVDPIFKLFLTRELLKLLAEGSEPIREGFADFMQQLESSSINWSANWLSHTPSQDVFRARTQALSYLELLRDWESRVQKVKDSYYGFAKFESKQIRWVGWVVRDRNTWYAELRDSAPDQELFVFRHYGDVCKAVPLGRSDGGTQQMITLSEAKLAGSPVYSIATVKLSRSSE